MNIDTWMGLQNRLKTVSLSESKQSLDVKMVTVSGRIIRLLGIVDEPNIFGNRANS